ncbi:YSIRK-type signal peptide-containing protein [Ligilactobacillus murinus]|uniref:mucin-binding protein n=1 Tax=Ligilactobacillus murinus TaxID=1622 RepID=UPI001C8CCC67|nr:YSIRK-type signal peptide-containing protein [Ligilactobacillus murinus]MBX9012283.1 YSIRK-type signal peptide-containing protein [Ligilactobacillus murinus]
MLSKNNKQLMVEKQAAKKQRYGLRKLSIGVASVLLGMTFLGAGSISAAENENLETATTENQVEAVSDPLNEQTEITLMPQAEAEKQTDGQAYEEKAVTRTINLYKDGELVDTKIQTVNFHKILGTWYVKNDGVVGVKTGQFEAYDIPEQAGYTAQVNGATVNKVDNMSVTADTPNQVVDVYYVANAKTYTEERVITRTINIWHDDKLFDVIRQEEVFTREVTENLTTGEKTYGAWDEPTKMFDEVTLPQYEGYKHTEGTVQKRCIVNPNSKNIVNDIKYTSEKEISEETRTVERVINLYKDGEHIETVKQSVTFTREVIKNLVTNKIEYGEWIAEDGKDHWDEYKAKELENYELENGVVDKKKVTADTPSETVSINYKAKVETTTEYDTVKRVINIYQDGKKVDEVTQVVEFSREVKKNLVTGETEYGEWVAKDGKDNWDAFDAPEYENYTTDTVKIDNEVVKPGMADQEVSINYTAKIDTRIEERFVQRTIILHLPNGETKKVTQDVTFKREVRKNLVTGEEVYGAWGMEKITFPEYEVPKVENYIPTMDKVEAAVVTPDTQSWTVDIYYGAAIETTTEYDTVKRVISIYHDGKKVDEVTQSVTFSREVKKNLATGEVTYGEWVAKDGKDIWEAFDAPEYENYTTDTVKIDNKTVKPEMEDEEAAIYYTSKVETKTEYDTVKRVINIYHDGKKVDEVTQSVTFSREVKKNLATGEVTYGEWIAKDGKDIWDAFDAPEYENYTTDTVKIDNKSVKPGMEDEEAAIYYTSKVETRIEYSTVKRVIGIYLDGKRVDEKTQSVTFKREVKKNLVTGEETYGDWDRPEDIWEAFDAPEYENYTTDTVKIDNKTVKPGMEDEEAAIYYTSKVETTTEYDTVKRVINIYHDGKKVDEVTQSVTFSREVKKNLATGEVTYGEWVAKDGKDIWEAFDAPEYENYTTDTVKIDNMAVKPGMEDEEAAIYYTSKVETRIEYSTVKRVIGIYQDGKKVDEVTQSVTFKREVKKNLATGEETYGDWDRPEDIWEAFDAPEYENYTTDTVKIDNKTVKPGMEDEEAAIYYTSKVETKTEYDTVKRVISIYQDGKKVDEVTQSVTFSREVKKNLATGEVTYGEWVAKDGKDIWEAFDAPEYENYTTDTVKIDNKTVKPGMEDEEAAIYYTSIVETELEERVVDRTIILNLPNGMKREHVQSVTFKREVKKNLATGEVTYGEWDLLPTELEAYAPPKFEGYVASVEEVEAIVVDPDSQSTTIEVDYYKIEQQTKDVKRTFTVRIVDGTLPRGGSLGGNGSQYVQSVTFERVGYINGDGVFVGSDWKMVKGNLNGFGIPQLEGYTTRRTAIESIIPSADMKDMEDEILYVAYATHEDTKIVTRTITITDPDGKTHVVEQKATFTRQVLTDQFTGQKTLGDWSVDQSTLEGITLPEFNGYKPSQQVDPLEVSPDSEDSELTITYEKVDPDTPTGPDNGDNEKPDTPTTPDNGDNEKPDTPTGPDNGDNEKPDTPTGPDNGDNEKPDTPTTPDNGDNEKPDTPTGPDNGDNEKPDTPTDPDNGNNGTPDKDPEATAGINNGGLENAKDELNSEVADQILNLSTKSNKDNGTMLKNMDSGQKGSNTKGLATQKDGNVASELPALGDETEVKGLGALLVALACMPLFLVAKGKKRKN